MQMSVTDRLDRLDWACSILERRIPGHVAAAARAFGREPPPLMPQRRKEEQEEDAKMQLVAPVASVYAAGIYDNLPTIFSYAEGTLFQASLAYQVTRASYPYVLELAKRAREEGRYRWGDADVREVRQMIPESRVVRYPNNKGWKISASVERVVLVPRTQGNLYNIAVHGWAFNRDTGREVTRANRYSRRIVTLMGIYDSSNIARRAPGDWRTIPLGQLAPMEVHLHSTDETGETFAFSPDTAHFRLARPELGGGLFTLVVVDPELRRIMVSLVVLEPRYDQNTTLAMYQSDPGYTEVWQAVERKSLDL